MTPRAANVSLLTGEPVFGHSGPGSTSIEISHQIKNLSVAWGRKDLFFDGAGFPLVVAKTLMLLLFGGLN